MAGTVRLPDFYLIRAAHRSLDSVIFRILWLRYMFTLFGLTEIVIYFLINKDPRLF